MDKVSGQGKGRMIRARGFGVSLPDARVGASIRLLS
jgi:hypothetical protein